VAGSACRGLENGRGDAGGPVPRDHDPVCAEAVGRPDQGAQVPGVLDPVEQQDETARKGRVAVGDDVVEGRIDKLPAQAQHALVGVGACLALDIVPAPELDRDPPGRGKLQDPLHVHAAAALGDDDLANVAGLALKGLQDGVDAVNDLHVASGQ